MKMRENISRKGLTAAFVMISAAGAIIGALIGTVPNLPWPLTLFSHFPHYYSLILTLGAVFLISLKHHKQAAFCAVLGLWNFGIVGVDLARSKTHAPEGPRLKLIQANLLTANPQQEKVEDWLLAQDADILVLMEVDERWWKSLDRVATRYPHGRRMLRSDNFGIALLSRLPLEDARLVDVGESGIPSIRARLSFAEKPLTILATHPLPPTSEEYRRRRNQQLVGAAKSARTHQEEGEFILIGDLNVTPWSSPFKQLLRESGLHDSRAGFGFQASWPRRLPLFLPLDHTLLSKGLTAVDRQLGDYNGSDHRPVVILVGPS